MPSTLLVPGFSISAVPHDVLVVVGVVVAVIAGLLFINLGGLLFINLGLLLPELLTGFSGRDGRPSADYPEFGPAAAPTISEPAPAVRRDRARPESDTRVVATGTRHRHRSLARSHTETGHAR